MTPQPHPVPANTLPRRVLAVVVTAALSVGLLVGVGGASPASAATGTIVSMTFDDANADQLPAEQKLVSKGMKGTFFLVSGFIGFPGYMTLANVQSMVADGQEIAGHTISHPDLATVSIDEATRQICNDRVNWANWGIPVANFAYPFASSTTRSDPVDCVRAVISWQASLGVTLQSRRISLRSIGVGVEASGRRQGVAAVLAGRPTREALMGRAAALGRGRDTGGPGRRPGTPIKGVVPALLLASRRVVRAATGRPGWW